MTCVSRIESTLETVLVISGVIGGDTTTSQDVLVVIPTTVVGPALTVIPESTYILEYPYFFNSISGLTFQDNLSDVICNLQFNSANCLTVSAGAFI